MSNTFGSCASGTLAAPITLATIAISARLLRRLPRIGVGLDGLRRRPALDRGVGGERHRARRHSKTGFGRGVMGDRLGQEIVETAAIAALGGGVVNFKQRLDLGAAHRLMLDGSSGQDARAPGGVIGIERTGEVDAALGGGTF